MRIRLTDSIAGHPAGKIREILRAGVGGCAFSIEYVEFVLGVDTEEASRTVQELDRLQYVHRQLPRYDEVEYWENTVKGNALALAKASAPLTRKTADQIVQRLVERAHRVNEDPHFIHSVRSITLFGSYLSSQPRLGDVDVAIELDWKISDRKERGPAIGQRVQRARAAGRVFRNIVDEICWPETEVRLFLKGRSRGLSFSRQAIEPTRLLFPVLSPMQVAVSVPVMVCTALGVQKDKQQERRRPLRVMTETIRIHRGDIEDFYYLLLLERREATALVREIESSDWSKAKRVSGQPVKQSEVRQGVAEALRRLRLALAQSPLRARQARV